MEINQERSVYVSTSQISLTDRGAWMNRSAPFIEGVTTDLGRMLTELERRAVERVRHRAEHPIAGQGWKAHIEFEAEWKAAEYVYRLPLNTMVSARKVESITGYRRQPGMKPGEGYAAWGLLEEPLSDQEVAAIRERETYREWNSDQDDPLKAVIKAAEKRLPKPIKDARPLYLAYEYTLTKRMLGVFDSFDAAIERASDDATIIEVPADAKTSAEDGKLLRGRFPSGWGYASGYAPADRLQATQLTTNKKG